MNPVSPTNLFSHRFAATKALWTSRTETERQMPEHRIIHSRICRLHEPVALRRLGVQPSVGYGKCGSLQAYDDHVLAFRLLSWNGRRWETLLDRQKLSVPSSKKPVWFDLGGVKSSSVIVEARNCEMDRGWTGWVLTGGAFHLEADHPSWYPSRPHGLLELRRMDIRSMPKGVSASFHPGEVRFKTRTYEVGFKLYRAGFSHLGLDDTASGFTHKNLLNNYPLLTIEPCSGHQGHMTQGIRLHRVGELCDAGPLDHMARGWTEVRGNTVRQHVEFGEAGQTYDFEWRIFDTRMELTVKRTGQKSVRAWESGAWHTSFNTCVSTVDAIGRITRQGETGLMTLPLILHAPGMGTFEISSDSPDTLWRSDSWRPGWGATAGHTVTGELKVGEIPQPEGDYLLPAGCHEAHVEFVSVRARPRMKKSAPPEIRRALERCYYTSMPYRADTGTLSNNSNSIHAILCADMWAAQCIRFQKLVPGVTSLDLLRDTLDRHLDGAPSYGSGRIKRGKEIHDIEDEYLMTPAAVIQASGDYLHATGDHAWFVAKRESLQAEIQRMKKRDIDGDGLVESVYRTGESGQGKWSTNWYDGMSFGWKDAFTCALLYGALNRLASAVAPMGEKEMTLELQTWSAKIQHSYLPTFQNPDTGWIAGWRCRENKLHDFGFLFVNGAAIWNGLVPAGLARKICRTLYRELMKAGIPDFRWGLPNAVRWLPFSEFGAPNTDHIYMNRALTHSQARHFLKALYQVGMEKEADSLLIKLCEGLADGYAFGGCGSGLDWKRWDGSPAGYEGFLCDQTGVLEVAWDRWGH